MPCNTTRLTLVAIRRLKIGFLAAVLVQQVRPLSAFAQPSEQPHEPNHHRADQPGQLSEQAADQAPGHAPGQGRAPTTPGSVVPPELTGDVEPIYPEAAADAKVRGRVLVALVIDATGKVVDASVVEGLGYGCDEAALTAAGAMRFKPAQRDGVPKASKITFAFFFEPPVPSVEAEASASRVEAVVTPEVNTAPPPAPEAIEPNDAAAVEIVVQGYSEAQRLRSSAKAVQVIELDDAKMRSGDLGQVLSRARGTSVQRAGGLGADARFSLNGFEGDQVRFFMDGLPLDYAGFNQGFANVPVNLLQRVEIYHGVVPVRFGSDALGGAVNLVTNDRTLESGASASYQAGAFDTHRLTTQATLALRSGFFLRTNTYFDAARNDYPIDVEVPNSTGRPSETRVRRFHDAYEALGVGVESGVQDTPYAQLLSARLFYGVASKQIQHDPLMIRPYGDVMSHRDNVGVVVRYKQRWSPALALESAAGVTRNHANLRDVGECVYTWLGTCASQRVTPGEIEGPSDTVLTDDAVFARFVLQVNPAPIHTLRLSIAPELVFRNGDEREQTTTTGIAAIEAERRLRTAILGAEYETHLFADALQNITFVKGYFQAAHSQRILPNQGFENIDRSTSQVGGGEALRYRIWDELWAKGSYEYATRLPRVDETFGDGILVQENLNLKPEVSHNGNLGFVFESELTHTGSWLFEVNGFLRDARDLIRRVGSNLYFRNDNVSSVRTLGAETTVRWRSVGNYLALGATGTFQDARNTSQTGPYAEQRGDRIPNRPYLLGNGDATVQWSQLATERDQLALTWTSRYVGEFYRTWESAGDLDSKPRVPTQFIHSLALVYTIDGEQRAFSTALEIENLTDARTYDFFGVQRPGRAAYFKTTFEL